MCAPFNVSSHLYTSAPYFRRLTWLAFDFSFPPFLLLYYLTRRRCLSSVNFVLHVGAVSGAVVRDRAFRSPISYASIISHVGGACQGLVEVNTSASLIVVAVRSR